MMVILYLNYKNQDLIPSRRNAKGSIFRQIQNPFNQSYKFSRVVRTVQYKLYRLEISNRSSRIMPRIRLSYSWSVIYLIDYIM